MHLRRGDVHHAELAARLQAGEDARHAKLEDLVARDEPHRIRLARLEPGGRRGRKPERAGVEQPSDAPGAGVRGIDHEGGLQAHRAQRVDAEDAQRLRCAGERGLDLHDRARRGDFGPRRDSGE